MQAYFDAEGVDAVDRSPEDIAALIFTAARPGSPKAAMLTHGNLLANLDQVRRHPGLAARADDVALGVLPLFHIFGLNVVLGLALHVGARVVLVERFDPLELRRGHPRPRRDVIAGAPPMFDGVGRLPGVEADAFRGVRLAVSGARPVADRRRRGRSRPASASRSAEGYGLTEASPVVTTSLVGGEARKGSIGMPLPGVEVRLVDADGEDVLAGDPGEIWVRGPNVFPATGGTRRRPQRR